MADGWIVTSYFGDLIINKKNEANEKNLFFFAWIILLHNFFVHFTAEVMKIFMSSLFWTHNNFVQR